MMTSLQTLLRPWKLAFVLTGLICILMAEATSACDFNPTAVMNHETGAVFVDDDTVLLSGSQSTANNCSGYIDQYRWQVRPVGGSWTTLYTGTSSTYSYSFPTLSAGENQKDYQVRLRVRNNIFLYNTTTITVTVARSHKSYYYLTDHLGSVRVTVNDAGDPVGWAASACRRNDYYPFGLQMPERTQNTSNPNDDEKFTGYLLEQEGDLGIYHAEARMYDPVIGRFNSVDPLADLFPDWNPYAYVFNNPMIYTDPTGMSPVCVESQTCDETYREGVIVENRLGSWVYLGDNQWETLSLADNATELTSGFATALHWFNNSFDTFHDFGDRTIAENSLRISTTSLLDNPATWLVGGVGIVSGLPSGLRRATEGLKKIYKSGSIRGKSIITIRNILTRNGFTQQGLTRNKQGYIFRNSVGEEVRIMRRNGKWDIRVQNRYGNNLDEFGNVGHSVDATHNINVTSH